MSTQLQAGSLAAALFGKTRRELLAFLFSHPDDSFYLRQVAGHVGGGGLGGVQRELKRLADVGLILRQARGRQVHYRANRQSPIFAELQGLLVKTVGVADVLR